MPFAIPPATQALIIINVLVFALELLTGTALLSRLALWPLGSGFGPWQLLTYGFLHGGLWHLLINMFALFMFGSELERLFGSRWYVTFFLVCIVTAAITQLAVAAASGGPPYPTVGASGGVFGLLLAFGMYFPHRTVVLIFPPIPLPAWLFVTLFGALELYFGITGTATGVAHFAHLGGMLGAWLMIQHRRGRAPFARRRP